MTSKNQIRVKRTPNYLHAYTATMKGKGTYGWGNTPAEARKKLLNRLAVEKSVDAFFGPLLKSITTERVKL